MMHETDPDKIPRGDDTPPIRQKKRCPGCLLLLIFLFLILALTGYWLYHLEMHYKTILSPCGKYRAECYYYFREAIMPMMPGGSGDKSGRLYIIRNADNRKLYQTDIPMVRFVSEIRFKQDSAGHTTTISAPIWLWFELP